MSDVLVVGGGPSGLNTANLLAQGGLNVRLFDRRSSIGKDIICTGIVGKEVFGVFDLNRDSILYEIQSARLISPYQTAIDYEHPEPFAFVVDRKRFDRNIAQKAIHSGVEIQTSTSVIDVRVKDSHVEAVAKDTEGNISIHKALMVVLATGVDVRLSRKIGLGTPTDYFYGVQAELDIQEISRPMIAVSQDLSPGAFAWMIPANGHGVRIGLLARRQTQINLAKLISRFFPSVSLARLEEGLRTKRIAQGLVRKTFADRALVVGEAAGQVKTTTGGGIYYGLLCSKIASEVILQGFERRSLSARDLALYERRWKERIKREILIGHFAGKIYSGFSNNQIEYIFQLAKTNGIIPLIKEEGDFDWHSGLILSLAKKIPVRSVKSILSMNMNL